MLTPNQDRHSSRVALLTAGREILAEEGLAGLSLRAITRRVGISAAASYRYFADREHLLAAIATSGVWELTAELEMAEKTSALPLSAQASAYVRFALKNPALYKLIFGPEQFGHYPEFESALATSYAVLATRIAKTLVSDAATSTKSLTCWCLLHGIASLAIDHHLLIDQTNAEAKAAELMKAVISEI